MVVAAIADELVETGIAAEHVVAAAAGGEVVAGAHEDIGRRSHRGGDDQAVIALAETGAVGAADGIGAADLEIGAPGEPYISLMPKAIR